MDNKLYNPGDERHRTLAHLLEISFRLRRNVRDRSTLSGLPPTADMVTLLNEAAQEWEKNHFHNMRFYRLTDHSQSPTSVRTPVRRSQPVVTGLSTIGFKCSLGTSPAFARSQPPRRCWRKCLPPSSKIQTLWTDPTTALSRTHVLLLISTLTKTGTGLPFQNQGSHPQ